MNSHLQISLVGKSFKKFFPPENVEFQKVLLVRWRVIDFNGSVIQSTGSSINRKDDKLRAPS